MSAVACIMPPSLVTDSSALLSSQPFVVMSCPPFYAVLSQMAFVSCYHHHSHSFCAHLDMIHLVCVYVWTNNWFGFMLVLLIIMWDPLFFPMHYLERCLIILQFVGNIAVRFLVHSAAAVSA